MQTASYDLGTIRIDDVAVLVYRAKKKYEDLLRLSNYIIHEPRAKHVLKCERDNAKNMIKRLTTLNDQLDRGKDISISQAADYMAEAWEAYGRTMTLVNAFGGWAPAEEWAVLRKSAV